MQEIINKTVLLCVEGSGYLSTGVGHAFNTVVELLNAEEPPLIWVESNMIDCPKLLDSVRFAALEMDEHLETFFDRKDHVHEVIIMTFISLECMYKYMYNINVCFICSISRVLSAR